MHPTGLCRASAYQVTGRAVSLAATVALALGMAGPAFAAPDSEAEVQQLPEGFAAPFECGVEVTYSTYDPNHGQDGQALDFIRSDGEPDLGTPILASASGTAHVQTNDTAGNWVYIDHENGWRTDYMHLDSFSVEDGEEVEQGTEIGEMGHTGDVDGDPGTHLHYEQRLEGTGQEIQIEGESLAPYPDGYGQEFLTSENCDGDDPPEQQETELEYSGAETVSNGAAAELAATLVDESGDPVEDRPVDFALGAEGDEQSCDAETNADGEASCEIESVEQPLTEDASIPVTVEFAGDEAYEGSEDSAEVLLEHVSGHAYGISAEVPVLGVPVSIDPTPDTGEVRTAEEETHAPECAQGVDGLGVVSADVLCAEVGSETDPTGVTSTASIEETSIGVPGLPVVELSGVTATSRSSCDEEPSGSVDLTLNVAGTPVEIDDTPNQVVDLGVAGTELVVNEQVEDEDGNFTVNAARLSAPGDVEIVVASSTSNAHNCA